MDITLGKDSLRGKWEEIKHGLKKAWDQIVEPDLPGDDTQSLTPKPGRPIEGFDRRFDWEPRPDAGLNELSHHHEPGRLV